MKKKIILIVLSLILLVVTLLGTTYAIFTYSKLGETENVIRTGTISFVYTENNGGGRGISLTDAEPVSDEIGRSYSTENYMFDFSVESNNTNDKDIQYEITLEKDNTSTLPDSAVKIYLAGVIMDEEEKILSPTLYSDLNQTTINTNSNEKTLYYGEVPGGASAWSKSFRLKMWVDENVDFESGNYNNKTFMTTVNVYADVDVVKEKNVYKEKILNGTDPVLKDPLVPVIIHDDGTVTKADLSNEWYSYENKEWANAIILKDETETYRNGEVIFDEDIESYFVWIPRYKYKIFDTGSYTGLTKIEAKEQIIEVVFEDKNTTASNGTTVGSYLTHPAFTSFGSNGFWVGKFTTGYDGATSTSGAAKNSVNTSKIVIKPNVYIWNTITVGNMFKNSYDYKRDLDSHMAKNTEWGAIAYLHHSDYGSAASLRLNNNSNKITGFSATEEPTKGTNGGTSLAGNRVQARNPGVDGTYSINYLNPSSVVSSTTGNYTGVYDMSGGVYEYVMAYTTGATTTGGSSGITSLYSGFFTNTTYTKYWDKYTHTSTSSTVYNKRILGDATGEMGPFQELTDPDDSTHFKSSWYKDRVYMVIASNPWQYRGGGYQMGVDCGAFTAGRSTGATGANSGYRIVLTPQ